MVLCNFGQILSTENACVSGNDFQNAWVGLATWADATRNSSSHISDYQQVVSEGIQSLCKSFAKKLFEAYQAFASLLVREYSIDINTLTHVNLSLIAKNMFWSKYASIGGFLVHPIEQSLLANEKYLRSFCRGGFSYSSGCKVDYGFPVHPENYHLKARGIIGVDINSSYGYAATNISSPCGFGSTFKNGKRQEKSQRYRFFEFRATFFTIYQWMRNGDKPLRSVYHNYSPLGLFFVGKHPLDLVGIFEDGSMELVQFDGAFVHGCPNKDCRTLPTYANGNTRKTCEDKTAARDEFIKRWIEDTGTATIKYRVIQDCCTPGYTTSELNVIFKAVPELQDLISGYSSITGEVQDLCPDNTFLAVVDIECKSNHLSNTNKHYGPLFTWNDERMQAMTWKAKKFLLTKDYYLYLKDNFESVDISNTEWAIFYKVDKNFPLVYHHFLSMRQTAASKCVGTFFKSVVNISCGLYGTNPDKISSKYIRLTYRAPKRIDFTKHEIIPLQNQQGPSSTMTSNSFDMFVIRTNCLSKHIRTKNNALPIFCAIIEFGKMRLNQLFYILNRSLDPRSFKLHYAQIDSSIFTHAYPNLLEALTKSPYFNRPDVKNPFHSTLPGHFQIEFEYGSNHNWMFCTPKLCAYAIKLLSFEEYRSKMSSVDVDSSTAYKLQMQLMNYGSATVQQDRRINKIGGLETNNRTLHLSMKK